MKWGEPIEVVGGKRPEWLRDDKEYVMLHWANESKWSKLYEGEWNLSRFDEHDWRNVDKFRLRHDHPYYAAKDDWTPDERTVRACIEALPRQYEEVNPTANTSFRNITMATVEGMSRFCFSETISLAHFNLGKLLPKPDPAKALVEEYMAHLEKCCVLLVTPQDVAIHFARWLITSGHYQPKGDV